MTTSYIGRRSKQTDWIMLIQRMLNATNYCLPALDVDGVFGYDTEKCVIGFQKHVGLIPDGKVGFKTLMALLSYKPFNFETFKKEVDKYLSGDDIKKAAVNLGVEEATIRAVLEVESLGSGFINGKPKILFEGHVFWQRLTEEGYEPHKLSEGYEDVLYMKWTKKHYKGGLAEYDRLEKAQEINTHLALESCSWGLFQVMGFHYKALRYPSIAHFVYAMKESEAKQLDAFIRYCRTFNLVDHLVNKEWAKFAHGYNGAGFGKNAYDTRLKKAYNKYKEK